MDRPEENSLKVALSHTRDPAEIPFGETFG